MKIDSAENMSNRDVIAVLKETIKTIQGKHFKYIGHKGWNIWDQDNSKKTSTNNECRI